jgi:hypothetical protein
MTTRPLDQARRACAPMGHLEYVVEARHKGRVEELFVLRPHPDLVPTYRANGVELPPGCRIVVDAYSLRPLGVLAGEAAPAADGATLHAARLQPGAETGVDAASASAD